MKGNLYKQERGAEYLFPKDQIINFYKSLKSTSHYDNVYASINEPIAVVTIDDFYDYDTVEILKKYSVDVTYLLLSYKIKKGFIDLCTNNGKMDIGLHFDKGYGRLSKQVQQFEKKTGRRPVINRNHRLWWRADNLDLAYLALNGFVIDSSKIGIKPYLPCIEGKILPIWEVPFSIYEFSCTNSLHAAYQPAKDFVTLFEKEVTPIVTLFHPLPLMPRYKFRSELERFLDLGKNKYGYKFMTLTQFYTDILKPQGASLLEEATG